MKNKRCSGIRQGQGTIWEGVEPWVLTLVYISICLLLIPIAWTSVDKQTNCSNLPLEAGKSAVMYAAEAGRAEVCRILLEGADRWALSCRITPLEEGVAQAHGPTMCVVPLYAAAGSGTGLWPHFMQCRSLD